jgi:hypothetical protein
MSEEFLGGIIAIKVKSLEESRFLINLASEHGYPREGADPMFEDDTYLEYPYYFIEQDDQLQANKTEDGALLDVEEICDFEAIFGELK